MNSNAMPLLPIFEKKLRLEVPLFQRQYVWSLEAQWEPFWEDIQRKFAERLEGRLEAPVHFLGAMVLDQKMTPTTHVEKRQVIDGQQRLTTIQIFLAAFRDFSHEQGHEELAKECETFMLNTGMMADPSIDQFKVWPTQVDRGQFADVMISRSRKALEAKHPLRRRKYARKPDPRPRMVEAYLFFHDQISEFFLGTESDAPLAAEHSVRDRLDECFQALKSQLKVVVIDLDQGDDAQVIFETLNARGEPLLPADLLRNYIFLRAGRDGVNPEELYDQYWRKFDDEFWRREVRQGRLIRPRSDLFVQHFLASWQTVDIPIKHLFVEYKFWIERDQPFTNVRDEVATLSRQGDHFRRLLDPQKGDPVGPLATFLERFDISTTYPLLLLLLDSSLSELQWSEVSVTLESYLLRRAFCGLTTKGYNRVFLALTKALRTESREPGRLRDHLAKLTGESAEWPTDEKFREAWLSVHAYRTLTNPRIVHILRKLNDSYLTTKSEDIHIETPLTVEHVLPQDWIKNWPLPDGSKGLAFAELWEAEAGDLRAEATQRRNAKLQTIGNLTILTQELNSSVSNSPWEVKKPALLEASLLPINLQLRTVERWDEEAIEARGKELFERAAKIWSRR